MTLIQMEIKDCQDCPHSIEERMYTADSWEHAYNYFCGKKKKKKIAGYVEWRREMPPVPNWCPLLPKKKKKSKKVKTVKLKKK